MLHMCTLIALWKDLDENSRDWEKEIRPLRFFFLGGGGEGGGGRRWREG